jgi:L-lactate dehydrogenase complex protein LldF
MVNTFHKHIQQSLANENLQIALDANAERRIAAREQAMGTLSEPRQILRQRAKEIRWQTINDLDQYLDQFIKSARANGMIVHRAADKEQAVQIVLRIAEEKGARLIAKSKTMVSEEIGINHALEAAGLQVIETDLGEYIIQLRDESPSHIITPAVHLRKEEVGDTFRDKLGIPYTTDIPVMAAAARERLRETFLEADIGLSGVNFGVAESGTICLVTNEGNGRMVTTLPPVHIALMGIERLVPRMDDLALMLELLPRSATGQKITVYTNLINSPRSPQEPDGPLERHLVLVDNGRQAMRESSLAEALLCIRCGACLNACPVFAEIGGHAYVNDEGESSTYPGPIGSIVSPGLFGQAEFGHFARASSLCGACKDACPVDIDLPKLLLRVRAGGATLNSRIEERGVPFKVYMGLRFYTWFATNSKRFGLALKLAGFLSKIIAPKSDWLCMPSFTGWGYSKDLPRPASQPFRERWANGLDQKASHYGAKYRGGEADNSEDSQDVRDSQEKDLIEGFADELVALDGIFSLCNREELPHLVLKELQKRGISRILSWEEDQLPDELIDSLRSHGIQVSEQFEEDIKVGITGALSAIAETGTIVLASGKGRAQFVSLTPEIHFVVLRSSDVVENIYRTLELPDLRTSSATTFISGPSRTADIEMTLTLGVHGPREVLVFCLQGE